MPRNIRIRDEMTEWRNVCYGICFNMSIVLDQSYFLSFIYIYIYIYI
jgi:hypothetical protein